VPKFLLTITGPSGSGKTSILHKLEKDYEVGRIVTCTTRPPRPKEKDGVDYNFITFDQYFDRISGMVAPVNFAGHRYGIWQRDIYRLLRNHDVVAVIVDPTGATSLFSAINGIDDVYVHNIYINIDPKTALARMAKRDGWKEAKKRQKADFEGGLYYDKLYEAAEKYDCILNNDRKNSVRNIAYDIMNYVEAQKWSMETLNSLAG